MSNKYLICFFLSLKTAKNSFYENVVEESGNQITQWVQKK